MMKWKFEKELAEITTILLNTYLTLSHSTVITVMFTDNNNIYAHDLTTEELNDLIRLDGKEKLALNNIGKARVKKYITNSTIIATTNDMEEMKNTFPKYARNNGYIAEFVYRNKINGETIEEIRKSNKSKPFDKASDTKDNRQLKMIDKGASMTDITYLLETAKAKRLDNITEIEKAIETLNKIYA